jgi:aromatic ring-cleaving dioxygenase
MQARNFRYNSEWMPKGFQNDWDAHIYFAPEQLDAIKSLHVKLVATFTNPEIFVGDVIPRPIGPHTLPMLEVNFSEAQYSTVVPWLEKERGSLNILVHPQTGDDYTDHTNYAVWLGEPVALKLEIFK